MKRLYGCVLVLGLAAAMVQSAHADIKHRIGVGAHYWKAVKDIDVDNVKESGFAWLASYQLRPASLIKFGLDVEMLPKEYGGADKGVFAPQVYVLLGSTIYAALGVGTYYTDGDFSKDPFFNLRAGLDISLLPFIHLDINANYRFEEWDAIKTVGDDIGSDTITLGAAVRLEI